MNTFKILSKLTEHSNIDKDSFNIVKDYVYEMEKYDKKKLEETKIRFFRVIDELECMSSHILNNEKTLLQDKAIKSVIVSESIGYKILDNIYQHTINMLEYLDDFEWERLNGYFDDDYYSDDSYGMFRWLNGASCDI